jgi:hypothetical protein
VVATVLLGVLAWDLDGRVSDLTDDKAALTAENTSLDRKVSDLTAERESLRGLFPITSESWADADLEGRYEFVFVPMEGGPCTYSDCDQSGEVSFVLSISRTADGYGLAIDGIPGTPAPMSRDGVQYSVSGVLPESLWGTCGDTPAETRFEMQLLVGGVGLDGSDLRAVEADGTYHQYTPATSNCGPAESMSTFTARRTA